MLNGRLADASLVTLAPGFMLERNAAGAWKNMQRCGKLFFATNVQPVSRYGSGYRSIAVQDVFYRAAHGDRAAAAKAGIDPTLKVNVAAPGGSSHGFGTRADTLFNGGVTRATLTFASWFGWSREYGADDQFHYMHDGHTFTVPIAVRNRVVGAYLNSRHLGKTTDVANSGVWPARSNMSWLLQTAGWKDGLYPSPKYKRDGVAGDRTKWLRNHYWSVLWA